MRVLYSAPRIILYVLAGIVLSASALFLSGIGDEDLASVRELSFGSWVLVAAGLALLALTLLNLKFAYFAMVSKPAVAIEGSSVAVHSNRSVAFDRTEIVQVRRGFDGSIALSLAGGRIITLLPWLIKGGSRAVLEALG